MSVVQPDLADLCLVLAQRSSNASTLTIVVWAAVLIGCALAGGVVVLFLRARLLGRGGPPAGPMSAMDGLRRMRDAGQITSAEFDAARASIVARVSTASPPAAPRAARASRDDAGAIVAAPGFDLTGRPLPPRTPPAAPRGDQADTPR